MGGHSDAALRRAFRFARAWLGVSVFSEKIAAIKPRLQRLAGPVGREVATLEVNSVYCLALEASASTASWSGDRSEARVACRYRA